MTPLYKPVLPFSATSTTTLSHDVIMSSNIIADAQSITPLAMIHNPAANGIAGNKQEEALVITRQEVNNETLVQLCHVARCSSSESGWSLTPLFTNIHPVEVAAGANRVGTTYERIHIFFTDAGNLYVSSLKPDGVSWDAYQVISTAIGGDHGISDLGVTYTPLGTMIVYGKTSGGNLITVYPQIDDTQPPTVNICNLGGALSDNTFALCMTDELNWYLTANEATQPILYVGTLDGKVPESSQPVGISTSPIGDVVFGYWSHVNTGQPDSAIWLFVTTKNELVVWSMGGVFGLNGQVIPTNGITLKNATGHVSTDGTLHIYFTDNTAAAALWVLHQYPGDDGWDENGVPVFAPAIPLAQGIAGLVSDTNPRDNASFFALDAADNTVRLHTQDVNSKHWNCYTITNPSEETYEIVRFRTELSLKDANGVPLRNHRVTLNVADKQSACEAAIMGNNYGIGSAPVPFTTDSNGGLTLSLLASKGIAAPGLELNAGGLQAVYSFQPAGNVHAYLSGKVDNYNPTNPNGALPTFDNQGTTLQNAKTPDGNPLYDPGTKAPLSTAATAISASAQVGLGSAPEGMFAFYAAAPDYADGSFISFKSQKELGLFLSKKKQAEVNNAGGDIWDKIKHFFGDILEGIKNGVIAIKDTVVTIADKVANFTLQLGDMIAQGVKIGIEGLEKAAHFMAGVFHWIGAAVDKVLDWLKALFDFKAIMRTTRVFESGLLSMPDYIGKLVGQWNWNLNTWFTQQETTVNDALNKMKDQYAGQTFGSMPGFHSPGPNGINPPVGKAGTGDFISNVHHNWLMEKVNACAGSWPIQSALKDNTPWDSFLNNLGQVGVDFKAAIHDFVNGTMDLIKDPGSLAGKAIPDFIDMIKNLVDALLKLCNAIGNGFLALADWCMTALKKVLDTKLSVGPLKSIWKYISGSDESLTVATLLSLMAAFPATIIYKLLTGGKEPFPDGSNPFKNTTPGLNEMPTACLVTAGILQIFQMIPAAIVDGMGSDAPWQLTLLSMANAGLVFLLINGNQVINYKDFPLVTVAFLVAELLIQTGKVALRNKARDIKDGLSFLQTLTGILRLLVGICKDIKGEGDGLQKARAILLPLPSVYSFLRMKEFRDDDPEVAPFAIAASYIYDFIGFVGGGACEVIDAMDNNKIIKI